MDRESYPYTQLEPERFLFISEGKRRIARWVTFHQMADKTVNTAKIIISPYPEKLLYFFKRRVFNPLLYQ